MKRFNVTSLTRDKEYDLTQGTAGSRVIYFTCNPNGEAEVIKVTLDPNPKLKKIFLEKDFSEILIKGRGSKGNLLTKHSIHRIALKSHGHSTLGGRKVWFDPDVNRLNYDEHGRFLGEFNEEDAILVVLEGGEFYITNFDSNNHYEDNIKVVEKWDPEKVWTAVLLDADQQGFAYLKRFRMEATKRHQNYLGENPASRELLLTDTPYPHLLVTLGGNDDFREPLDLEAEEFIGVKSFKAKGKRITTCNVARIEELEPTRQPEVQEEPEIPNDPDSQDNPEIPEESQDEVADQLNGQLRLFE
jgi:topoisomerase-4 subunit A